MLRTSGGQQGCWRSQESVRDMKIYIYQNSREPSLLAVFYIIGPVEMHKWLESKHNFDRAKALPLP